MLFQSSFIYCELNAILQIEEPYPEPITLRQGGDNVAFDLLPVRNCDLYQKASDLLRIIGASSIAPARCVGALCLSMNI
jgi:hypothetical protein